MSFYGNISNAGKTQMSFDRVYPNRKIMEENASKDGVFVGRFVLVEYDDNTYSHRTGYINFLPEKDEERNGKYSVYINAECTIPFKLTESNDDGYGLTQGDLIVAERNNYYYYFQCNGKTNSINGSAYFNYVMSSSEFFDKGVTDYTINYNEDKEYAKKQKYPFTTGWDSTVWRKVFKNGKEQYQMIASLSSVTPKFSFVPEAPTLDPIMPHFGINSTNINYDLHFQPNWGLKVREIKENEKSDFDVIPPEGYKEYNPETGLDEEIQSYPGAIYFNKDGFNPEVISHVDQEDEVSILPTGTSGQKYIVHTNNGDIDYEERPDTQEITLNLPSIGNTISDIWNIVYGPSQSNPEKLRDMNLSWDDNTSGNRLVTEDPDGNGYQYNPNRIETIAGSINSVHDLMGRIIINSPPPNGDIELANANKIYYGKYNSDIRDNKGFYFKDKTYKLEPFKDDDEKKEYVGKRVYQNLTQFSPNVYYTYSNRNFYLDKSTTPTQDTLYYKLGEPIKVPLKQWQPEITETDPDTGEEIIVKQYSYYKNEYLDYIKDKSKQPDQNKTYYQITTTKVTNPKHKDENDNSEIIKFFWPAGLDSNSNKFLGLASSIISNTEDLEILGGNDDAENLEDKSIIQQGYFYRQVNENGNDLLIPCTDLTKNDYNPDTEYFYFDKYALSAESQDDKGIRSRVAYIITTKLEGTITTNRLGPNFTEALNNETYYEKYLKPNLVKMIPFEDNKYYYEIEDETIEGYKCIHNLEDNIFNKTTCYTIEATYEAGIINNQPGLDTPPNEEGGENNPEEIFFYKPNLYFIKDRNNYLLSKSVNMSLEAEYYLLTDKNNKLLKLDPNRQDGTLLITPETDKFYEPSKYYYRSSEFETDILDNGIIMKTAAKPNGAVVDPKTGLIYYTLQEAYVVEDTAGILKAGSVWDKAVAPPDTVKLGIRTETYKWTELKGFAEQLNTIHGLILEINKFLKFNDTLTRDRTTVQGCINQINDIINIFGEINPSDTVIINEYGQFAGARYITDKWISISTDGKTLKDPSITINHAGPTNNTTQIGETTAKTLQFGDSFKSYNFGIDEKGHINNTKTSSVDIKLPSLSITNGTTGNVLTGLKVSADGQSIVANSSDIGTLQLASYEIKEGSELAANDSINDAFGKLQGQIKALDFADTNANNTQFISKITQADGKISVERHNAGDLVLTGYSVATAKTAISTADTINSAFGKVEYRLNILQADSTQEGSVAYQIAQIVNENNNGSIDTLNEIAAWIINDETGTAKMNKDISDLKTDVSGLKEQVQTATTGLLDRTTFLENLVGEKTVSAQINEALFVNDEAIYALASDLSNSNQRIEELENNVDTWNAAEANVQSDWNESDTTSDAYILNKPDLTNIVETTSQFDYTVGDTTNQLTIAQLVAKVAELEATIQTLTAST